MPMPWPSAMVAGEPCAVARPLMSRTRTPWLYHAIVIIFCFGYIRSTCEVQVAPSCGWTTGMNQAPTLTGLRTLAPVMS